MELKSSPHFPPSKANHVRLIGDSAVSVGMTVSMCGCLSVQWSLVNRELRSKFTRLMTAGIVWMDGCFTALFLTTGGAL